MQDPIAGGNIFKTMFYAGKLTGNRKNKLVFDVKYLLYKGTVFPIFFKSSQLLPPCKM